MDSVSLGDIAGMIAALAFAFLVFRLGSVIGKAGKILDETRVSLRSTTENVQPTLLKLTDTVSLTNAQLARVDVCIVQDDHGCVSAEIHGKLLQACRAGDTLPSGEPPGEGHHSYVPGPNDFFGHFPVAVNNREGFRREAGAHEGVREQLG